MASATSIRLGVAASDVQKITFPSECTRCLRRATSNVVRVYETNFLTRQILSPFGWIPMIAFFGLAGVLVIAEDRLRLPIAWLLPLSWVTAMGLLRAAVFRSCRTVLLPYCRKCQAWWSWCSGLQAMVGVVFALAWSTSLFLTGRKMTAPDWLLVSIAISFGVLFFGHLLGLYYLFDPPVQLRKSLRTRAVLTLGNRDFARNTAKLNENLLVPLDGPLSAPDEPTHQGAAATSASYRLGRQIRRLFGTAAKH